MQIENVGSLLMSILEAFLSKEKTVVIRALLTLRKLLSKLDKMIYSSLCTKIASSYCALMDHVSQKLSRVEGRCSGFGRSPSERPVEHPVIAWPRQQGAAFSFRASFPFPGMRICQALYLVIF